MSHEDQGKHEKVTKNAVATIRRTVATTAQARLVCSLFFPSPLREQYLDAAIRTGLAGAAPGQVRRQRRDRRCRIAWEPASHARRRHPGRRRQPRHRKPGPPDRMSQSTTVA